MNYLKKTVLVLFMALSSAVPTSAYFYGAQHWKDETTGKDIYLAYEAHFQKDFPAIEVLTSFAEKENSKVLIESNYSQTKQNPSYVNSALPMLHAECAKKDIAVEDIDIRGSVPGAYKDGEFITDNKILAQRCESTINAFELLQKEIELSGDPLQAKNFYADKTREIKNNPFFQLMQKAYASLKKGKKKWQTKNSFYKKIGKQFIKDCLTVAEKNEEIEILKIHRKLTRKKTVKEKFPHALIRYLARYHLGTLVDIRATRSMFEALKKHDSIIICAGGKHCAPIASLLGKMKDKKFVDKIGDPSSMGWSADQIELKPLFQHGKLKNRSQKSLRLNINVKNGGYYEFY